MGAFDGYDFAVGLSIGESGKQVFANAAYEWKARCLRAEARLEEVSLIVHSRTFSQNAGVALIREMLEELQESNTNSPLADKSYLRARLQQLAEEQANESGFTFVDYASGELRPLE